MARIRKRGMQSPWVIGLLGGLTKASENIRLERDKERDLQREFARQVAIQDRDRQLRNIDRDAENIQAEQRSTTAFNQGLVTSAIGAKSYGAASSAADLLGEAGGGVKDIALSAEADAKRTQREQDTKDFTDALFSKKTSQDKYDYLVATELYWQDRVDFDFEGQKALYLARTKEEKTQVSALDKGRAAAYGPPGEEETLPEWYARAASLAEPARDAEGYGAFMDDLQKMYTVRNQETKSETKETPAQQTYGNIQQKVLPDTSLSPERRSDILLRSRASLGLLANAPDSAAAMGAGYIPGAPPPQDVGLVGTPDLWASPASAPTINGVPASAVAARAGAPQSAFPAGAPGQGMPPEIAAAMGGGGPSVPSAASTPGVGPRTQQAISMLMAAGKAKDEAEALQQLRAKGLDVSR